MLFTHAFQRVGTQGPSSFSSLAIFFIPTQRIRGKKNPTVKRSVELQRMIGKTS